MASPYLISNAIADALEQSNAFDTIRSSWGKQPRVLNVRSENGESIDVYAYAWTITPGGKGRNIKDEYRIQVTKSLQRNPDGPTVLLGYDPVSGMFCGFDIDRRSAAHSPSVQLKGAVFDYARRDGMAIHNKKGTGERVIAMRPDQLLEYILHSQDFHSGKRIIEVVDAPPLLSDDGTSLTLEELAKARQDADDVHVNCKDYDLFSHNRKKRLTSTKARSELFRRDVHRLDHGKCVLCGKGFRICGGGGRTRYVNVQAAHICPVAKDGSDHYLNGIDLCPEHHDMFDRGFWTLSDDLTVIIPSNASVDGVRGSIRELTNLLEYEGKRICDHREHRFKPAADATRHHRKMTMEVMKQMSVVEPIFSKNIASYKSTLS